MNSPVKQPRALSKRALAARLMAQKRADAVLAPQRPAGPTSLGTGPSGEGYVHYLRTGGY